MTTRALLRAAGILAWAFAGIPAVRALVSDGVGRGPFLGWAGAFLVFGVSFWRATGEASSSSSSSDIASTRRLQRLVALQSIAALTMLMLFCTGFETSLLIVVAVELGLFFPTRIGLPWLLVQSAFLEVLASRQMGWHFGSYWSFAATGFEAFAFTIATIAGREVAARRELSRTNAELEAARERVAVLSRDAERLRIARDLHDLLGHDLAALHLNLEAAKHLTNDNREASESIERAQRVAKDLFTDLRKALSALRGGPSLVSELRAIVDGVTGAGFSAAPRIHLDSPDRIDLADEERSNALVRCVQEIVTNAMKHAASASNLWIEIRVSGRALTLTAHDDGCGAKTTPVAPGNGLSGMCERFQRLGGEVTFSSGNDSNNKGTTERGFYVRATLPMAAEP